MTTPKHNTGDVELRDYEQYIHWQFVALLRGLRLPANLSPAQEQLIKSKAQLIAATIDEDLAAREAEARQTLLADIKAKRPQTILHTVDRYEDGYNSALTDYDRAIEEAYDK